MWETKIGEMMVCVALEVWEIMELVALWIGQNDGVCDTEEWGDGGIGGTEIGQIAVRVAMTVGGISRCKWHLRLGK